MNGVNCYPLCLVLGGVGALMASLAELTAKGEVSTILRVREVLNSFLGISAEPIYILLFFVLLGGVQTFVAQVTDLKKSLYVGASVITLFLTIIPNELPPSVGGGVQSGASRINGANDRRWINFFGPEEALAQSSPPENGVGRVQLNLIPKDGKEISGAVLTVREASSGHIVARSKFDSVPIEFSQRAGKYLLVIEVNGYQVQTREFGVTSGQTEQITVDLAWHPLPLQRLFRSY